MSVLTSIPTGTFLGTTHFNNVAAIFPPGQKITVKQDAATGVQAGHCTFIYHRFDAETVACAAKLGCQMHTGTMDRLTTDYSDMIVAGPGAIGLAVITDDYYGWFQCGGPICNGNALALAVATLDANFATDDSVAAKSLVCIGSDSALKTCTIGTDGEYGFMVADTTDTNVSTGVGTIDAEFLYVLDKFAPSL